MKNIKIQFLGVNSVTGETPEIAADTIRTSIPKCRITEKVVGFCGNYTSTDIGGAFHQGKKLRLYKLKDSVERRRT
jgi:hypothetical protein